MSRAVPSRYCVHKQTAPYMDMDTGGDYSRGHTLSDEGAPQLTEQTDDTEDTHADDKFLAH